MSENVKNIKEEKVEGKKFISEKNLAVVITAGVLALILIAAAVVSLVQAIQSDVWFDYMNSDLGSYIELSEEYKNIKLNVDVAKPHDIDIDVSILNMIYEDREKNKDRPNAVTGGRFTLSAGDEVKIWYNGYLLDEDGNKVYVDGMCNFSSTSPHTLGLGSSGFIPGFELNLVGKNIGDYDKFEKIVGGSVTENLIVYVSYSQTNKTDSTKTDKFTNVRMDLSEDLDAKYGAGFEAALMELTVGGAKTNLKAKVGETEVTYTDFTVNFAVEGNKNPIIVETYFPYDYSQTNLRNETAYFEVYVSEVIDYICPEFTDEYLTKKIEDEEINVTLEELNKYEGATLVDKYYKFAKATMDEIYEGAYKGLVESAVWEHFSTIVKVKKYPGAKVDEMFDYYLDELSTIYINNGGQAYDSTTGQYKTHDTLESYIAAYLGLSSSQNWKTYITNMAQNAVKERMTMYYLLKAENLLPTEAEYNAKLAEIRQEFIDEYVIQYMEYEGKTEKDYTDEEYAEIVRECTEDIDDYYDEDYFAVRVYYAFVAEAFIEWADVTTLDERRAYPFDK